MTALYYMEKQLLKHSYNLGMEIARGAPEEVVENIRRKIGYYEEAVVALRTVATDKKVGSWIIHVDENKSQWAECSECHVCGNPHLEVCPVCGAKMNGGIILCTSQK